MDLVIRQDRITRRWTQAYVGKQIGTTKAAVHDIETARRRPSYEVLVKLEDLFGKSHRELFAPATDNLSIADTQTDTQAD